MITVIVYEISDFYLNYDYIVSFVNRYKQYIFFTYPSFYYVDTSKFDPNDDVNLDVNDKFRCFQSDGFFYAGNKDFVVVDNNLIVESFTEIQQCYTRIFQNAYLNVNNYCTNNNTSNICKNLKKTFL